MIRKIRRGKVNTRNSATAAAFDLRFVANFAFVAIMSFTYDGVNYVKEKDLRAGQSQVGIHVPDVSLPAHYTIPALLYEAFAHRITGYY